MFQNFDLGVFLLAVLPVLLAITVREVARGYTARYWGDNTAEQYGRLTLNPLPHIDLVGTIIVPLLTLMFTPFLFGWARPIPIDSRNFRNPRLAWRCVAASGPLSNLAMAVLWGVVLVLTPYVGGAYQMPLAQMANYGISDQCDSVRAQHHPHPALGRRHFHRHLPVGEIFANVPQNRTLWDVDYPAAYADRGFGCVYCTDCAAGDCVCADVRLTGFQTA